MTPLFRQFNFTEGLNALLDQTKLDRNNYSLLINGRVRDNVVTPINSHLLLDAPAGKVQLIYEAGIFILLIVSGRAYLKNLVTDSTFQAVSGWQPMSATAPKCYAEQVPTTFAFFTRTGEPQIMFKSFPGTVGGYPACILVQDGINQPQAIFPDGTSKVTGTYDQWSLEVPNYVPIGTIMCYSGTKLYIVSPDGRQIYQSVSGRPTDFVVNLNTDGTKGGDASTISTAVSYNPVTGMFAQQDGSVFVTTAYSAHFILLDYNNTLFGEPTLVAQAAFRVGGNNERSLIPVVGDTAFIASNGIQSFNFAQMVKNQTNVGPFGANIYSLLKIPQSNTCAVLYDDYALFSMQTKFGNGVVVYDTMQQMFVGLDLNFGAVQQFAHTLVAGRQRLFFYTDDNLVYEAYAGPTDKAAIYLGDYAAGVRSTVHTVSLEFTNIKGPGTVRCTMYADKENVYSGTQAIKSKYVAPNNLIQPPYALNAKPEIVRFSLPNRVPNAAQVGIYVEWDMPGSLVVADIYGESANSYNDNLIAESSSPHNDYLVFGNLWPGPTIVCSGVAQRVVKDNIYYFTPTDSSTKVTNGTDLLTAAGYFTAQGEYIWCNDATPIYDITDGYKVITAATEYNPEADGYILLGDTHPAFDTLLAPLGYEIIDVLGDRDYVTGEASFMRYGYSPSLFANFYSYNSGYKAPNYSTVVEPDGNSLSSKQYQWLQTQLAQSSKYNIICTHIPYLTDDLNAPSVPNLNLPFGTDGATLVLTGNSYTYERRTRGKVVYINLGVSGADHDTTLASSPSADVVRTGFTGYGVLSTSELDIRFFLYDETCALLDQVTIR